MLVEIPPKMAVSGFVGYLKGKSSTLIYEQFGELKYKNKNRKLYEENLRKFKELGF